MQRKIAFIPRNDLDGQLYEDKAVALMTIKRLTKAEAVEWHTEDSLCFCFDYHPGEIKRQSHIVITAPKVRLSFIRLNFAFASSNSKTVWGWDGATAGDVAAWVEETVDEDNTTVRPGELAFCNRDYVETTYDKCLLCGLANIAQPKLIYCSKCGELHIEEDYDKYVQCPFLKQQSCLINRK